MNPGGNVPAPQSCDVLVIGGGPAGSTIAALLAQGGRHVVLLEKDRFPRFHIGESLLPLNLPLFDRLGVAADVQRIGVHKPGAEVISDEHGAPTRFRFADNPQLGIHHSYHVRRAEFDKLLLDNCRRLGATVLEGVRVTKIEFGSPGRTTVRANGPDGASSLWFPRYLVDASGRDTVLASHLRIKRVDKRNNTAALFGHFRNVPRRKGEAEGMITMHLFEHGWFWMIPLPDDVMSVGVVGTQAFFKTKKDDLGSFFARAVAASPKVAERMANAEPIGPLTATANYSYYSQRCTGDGYILIGDAASFIDPLFSSGVMMAMSSAAFAAEVVDAWLSERKLGERLGRDYEGKMRRGLQSLSWLIYRINSPVLRDIFMSSIDFFNTRNELLAILGGDFYQAPRLLSPTGRLQAAYGCLYLLSKLGFRLRSEGLVWNPPRVWRQERMRQ
ncbi:MAG TPA: NAD(P)/FAD-dependent oxidoreductase [Stellaceae bacterium]|nr:NAD(P)/FAD-dependent oxidoreductase [Stellaceae bacterium]